MRWAERDTRVNGDDAVVSPGQPEVWGLQSAGGDEVCGVEEEEQGAAEGEVAVCGVVPLFEGVHAAAASTRADGEGGDVEGEGEIGVGRADAGFGGEIEVAVDCAEAEGEGGIFREGAGGTVSDTLNVEVELFVERC